MAAECLPSWSRTRRMPALAIRASNRPENVSGRIGWPRGSVKTKPESVHASPALRRFSI